MEKIYLSELKLKSGTLDWKFEKVANRKLGKLGIFFPSFFLPSFRFWVLGENGKVEREKVGKNIPRFPSFPSFPSFRPED